MTIAVSCPQCRRTINAGERFAGKKVRCPDCQTVVEVPASGQESAQPQAQRAPQTTMPQAAAPPAQAWSQPVSSPSPPQAGASELFVRLPDGRQVGPLTQAALTQAVQQGQVTAACQIWQQGWPQPRWAGELFPALAQQAATPPMGNAPTMGYPPGSGQSPGMPPGYAFDPLTGGYGAVAQHAAPHAGLHGAPAMLGIPQVPWGSMQSSTATPKKKKRRDGPFGRASDGRGFAIVMVICGLVILQELIATGFVVAAVANAASEAKEAREEGRGLRPVRGSRNPPLPSAVVGWVITLSLVGGMVSRKSSAQSGTAGLLLVRALLCGPLQYTIYGGNTVFWMIVVPFLFVDVVMAVVLAVSPSVKIYFGDE